MNNKKNQQVKANVWLGLLHLSGIFRLIFPTIIIWNQKKGGKKGMSDHYRDVIGFQLKIWFVILAGLWIYWKVNQPIPLIGGLFVNGLFSVFNTIKVISGKSYTHLPDFKRKTEDDRDK